MSIMSMTERVELEKGSRKVSEIKELNLDNSKATEIEGLTDKFENLEQLSLVNIGLQTLSALPELTTLKKIDLADNRLSGNFEPLVKCTNLEQVNLSGNEIKSLDSITSLKELKNLRCLDLSNCPLTEAENYRQEVFELIPHLKYLDGFDSENREEPAEVGLANGTAQGVTKNGDKAVTGNGEAVEDDYYEDEEGDDIDDEDDDEDVEDEEDEKEDYGLAALRGEAELSEDEEDYVPEGEEEDEEFDDEEEDEVLEAETADESGVANLSAAGVTGSRRTGAVKRRNSDLPTNGTPEITEKSETEEGDTEVPPAKKPAIESEVDGEEASAPTAEA